MNATYRLVELVKGNRRIDSDYGIAKLIKTTSQKLSNWKTGQSEANALNTLKLIKEAGISIDQAIEILESAEPKTKKNSQGGYSLVSLLLVTALLSCSLVASIEAPTHCILCKIDNTHESAKDEIYAVC